MNASTLKTRLEARRKAAARLLKQGKGIREVARLVHAAPSSVCLWNKRLAQGGIEALAIRRGGHKPRLNDDDRQRLVKILLRGPRASGFWNDLWTCSRVAQVIERRFGVRFHRDHVWKILRSLGWTCQKPERRARERDEAAIRRWRESDWPRIKKEHSPPS